jgi:hypothetical protein
MGADIVVGMGADIVVGIGADIVIVDAEAVAEDVAAVAFEPIGAGSLAVDPIGTTFNGPDFV